MKSLLLLMLCATAALAHISETKPTTGTCLCVCAGCETNLRDKVGLSDSTVNKTAKGGECFEYLGKNVKKDGEHLFLVSHSDGEVYWASGRFLNAGLPSDCGRSNVHVPRSLYSTDTCGVISRRAWGASRPREVERFEYRYLPIDTIIIHHTVGGRCFDSSRCKTLVRNIQHYHMNGRGWKDIGYNFLVGEDGNVYEGRGWENVGAHSTRKYNVRSLGFAVLGDFTNQRPESYALRAMNDVLWCGATNHKVTYDYRLYGGKDLVSTESPGAALHAEIKTWSHYAGQS